LKTNRDILKSLVTLTKDDTNPYGFNSVKFIFSICLGLPVFLLVAGNSFL